MNGSSYYNSFSNLSSATTTPFTQTTLTTTTSNLSEKLEYEKLNSHNDSDEISNNASLLQIQKLNEIEKKIGTLLQVASQAISVLSGDKDENIKGSFEELSVQYLELVNDIQIGLRETFRFLTNTDIESTSFTTNLPYISNTYGEEKDHEISVKILELVKTKINSILNSMGGSTIPLPISLSSSSIASGTPNINVPSSLNHKFLNSRFNSNAELIVSSLCSSNNNSNANIKIDDELANDIYVSGKKKIKKDEDLMEIDVEKNINMENNNYDSSSNNNNNNDNQALTGIKKEEIKNEKTDTNDFMNINNSSEHLDASDLDLDF